VVAHGFLPLAGALLLFGEAQAAALAFALGFVGLAVSGMLVKIVSFLSWTAGFAQQPAGVTKTARPPADTARAGATVATGSAVPAPVRAPRPPLLRDLVRPELEPLIGGGVGGGALAAVAAVLTGSIPVATVSAGALTVGALAQLAQVLHVIWAALRGTRQSARVTRGTREEVPA